MSFEQLVRTLANEDADAFEAKVRLLLLHYESVRKNDIMIVQGIRFLTVPAGLRAVSSIISKDLLVNPSDSSYSRNFCRVLAGSRVHVVGKGRTTKRYMSVDSFTKTIVAVLKTRVLGVIGASPSTCEAESVRHLPTVAEHAAKLQKKAAGWNSFDLELREKLQQLQRDNDNLRSTLSEPERLHFETISHLRAQKTHFRELSARLQTQLERWELRAGRAEAACRSLEVELAKQRAHNTLLSKSVRDGAAKMDKMRERLEQTEQREMRLVLREAAVSARERSQKRLRESIHDTAYAAGFDRACKRGRI